MNLQIGEGTPTTGTFSSVQWGMNSYFLQVQADIGTGYVNLGTTQFISVAYAMVADTVLHGAGPKITSVTGTASLIANNSVLNYALIPGLSKTITVPIGNTQKVLIQTDGGVQLNDDNPSGSGFTDIAIFINGVKTGLGRRVPAINNAGLGYSVNAFSFSTITTLTAGTYIIDVRAKKFSSIFWIVSFINQWINFGRQSTTARNIEYYAVSITIKPFKCSCKFNEILN